MATACLAFRDDRHSSPRPTALLALRRWQQNALPHQGRKSPVNKTGVCVELRDESVPSFELPCGFWEGWSLPPTSTPTCMCGKRSTCLAGLRIGGVRQLDDNLKARSRLLVLLRVVHRDARRRGCRNHRTFDDTSLELRIQVGIRRNPLFFFP